MAEETRRALTGDTVATFSRRLSRLPHLAELIGARRIVYFPIGARGIDAVIGWKAHTGAAAALNSSALPQVERKLAWISVGASTRQSHSFSTLNQTTARIEA